MSLLEVDSLAVEFRTRRGIIRAVDNVSFSLNKGETLGLVGESGSGKSTLGHSLIRLVPYPGLIVGGHIKIGGKDILSCSEEEMRFIRGENITFVFQDPMTSLNPVKKIGAHLVELIRTHKPDISKEEAVKLAESALNDVGISPERIDDYPHQFSGGMRQRIMIALAIALNPDIVIADEPSTALDVIVQAKILDLLESLRDAHGMALILITHDISVVLERCEKLIVMYAGNFVEYADSLSLHKDPKHPYTQGLLRTVPNIELADQKLEGIPGSPPDLLDLPNGCRFWPRCPQVMSMCRKKEPPMIELGDGHSVRCFLYEGAKR